MPHPPDKKSLHGFTLIEVLLSSVILLMVMVFLFGIGNGASRLWSESEGKRQAAREVRASLQMITEDLHSAILTTNSDNESMDLQKTPGGDSLFFLVSHPGDRRHEGIKGDLCAAGYFLAADPKENGYTNLYRFHSSGEPVAKVVERGRERELYSEASPQNTSNTELLARHIVFLRILALPKNTKPPEFLQITLSAISDGAARLIASHPEALERNERLLKQREQSTTAIIHLPPPRETIMAP